MFFLGQVVNDKGYDGRASDVWSCGVILFVLMAGFLPFDESNLMALYRKVSILYFYFVDDKTAKYTLILVHINFSDL